MPSFVCWSCRNIIRNKYDQYGKYTEYVRVDRKQRPHVILEAKLCRKCMEAEVAAREPAPGSEQPHLL